MEAIRINIIEDFFNINFSGLIKIIIKLKSIKDFIKFDLSPENKTAINKKIISVLINNFLLKLISLSSKK